VWVAHPQFGARASIKQEFDPLAGRQFALRMLHVDWRGGVSSGLDAVMVDRKEWLGCH
jgi:hypothetical protein